MSESRFTCVCRFNCVDSVYLMCVVIIYSWHNSELTFFFARTVEAITAAILMDKEILKAFDRIGDVAVWLQKLKLVAELKNLGTLAALILLYLEGAAFSVYNELNDEDKKTY